jgi:hypothetical protein
MIQRALHLKQRLWLFSHDSRFKDDLKNDNINEAEWTQLALIQDGLEPFVIATTRLQGRAQHGHHGSVWEVLLIMEYVMQQLEKEILRTKPRGRPTPIQVASQNAWEKLRKYYNETDNSWQIYAAGTLFNPVIRREWFDRNWTSPETSVVKDRMLASLQQTWATEYAHQLPPAPIKHQTLDPIDDFIFSGIQRSTGAGMTTEDEFEAYTNGRGSEGVQNLIQWWIEQASNTYPQLSRQALDVLSIPAMSAEVERLFSSTGQLITPRRNRLQEDTIEEVELLKQWLDAGLVDLSDRIEATEE